MAYAKSMNSLEIFAGGGGLALGVTVAGFAHVSLIEWDTNSAKTLYHNHKQFGFNNEKEWIFNDDIHNVSFSSYQDKIDLLSGGPPCQPFSIGGKHRAYNDKRDLFSEATRTLAEIRPKAFIFENVRGLLRKNFSKYFSYIILQLTYPEIVKKENEKWIEHLARLEQYHTSTSEKSLHYKVVFRLLNAADYGIPQKRERVFIIGFRSDINGNWSFPIATHSEEALHYEKYISKKYWEKHSVKYPNKYEPVNASLFDPPEKKPWVTVRDAIGDLPNPTETNNYYNHKFQGGAKAYPGHTGSVMDEPAKTIKAGAHGVPGGENMIVLDDGALRYLTVREAARIQTFPDNYFFPCSWTESMRQIGNAVPVKLGAIVADSVKRTLYSAKGKRKNNGYGDF
ncbi:MAG: DNA cytosine methyltransferase [Syntrophomonadaceae bacterium]|jgi:DNA (cytosine-5)-methyltransferase 1|nr:DNA cytosine methyltransferase [Syntrophomonadaceae bacterium]